MKHPHAEIIKALADDGSLGLWVRCGDGSYYRMGVERQDEKIKYVMASANSVVFHLGSTPPHRMIETPYGSYPEPLREAPKVETEIFIVERDGSTDSVYWTNYPWQITLLAAGALHLTKEAAEQQARVELKRRMAELGWEKTS